MTEGEQLSLIGSKEMSHGGASEHDACQEEISVTMQTSSDSMRCGRPTQYYTSIVRTGMCHLLGWYVE